MDTCYIWWNMQRIKEKKDWQWSNKGINYFLPEILMINESWNLISPRYTWRHPNNSGSFKCYLPLMIFSMQKIKDINWFFPVLLLIKECKKSNGSIDSFQRCWSSKNPAIWLDERHNWSHLTKVESLRCC